MTTTKSLVNDIVNKKEISFHEIYLFIKSKFVFILAIAVIFAVIGIIKGSTSRDEYDTTSKLLSESSNLTIPPGLSGILSGQLRQQTTQNQSAIGPDLYPAIVNSDGFLRSLLFEEFFFEEEQKKISLLNYLTDYEELDLISTISQTPKKLLGIFNKKSAVQDSNEKLKDTDAVVADTLKDFRKVLKYSSKEQAALSRLRERITMSKAGQLFEVVVRMPDPVVATQLNQLIINKLIVYVDRYQTGKEKENYNFILEQKQEAEKKYLQSQQALVYFQDHNRGLISATGRSKETQLQNDYSISYSLFNQLAQQLDQAQIKLQEAKPVVSVFEPPVVPLTKAAPNVISLTIVFSLVGIFIGLAIIFIQIFIAFFKKWTNG